MILFDISDVNSIRTSIKFNSGRRQPNPLLYPGSMVHAYLCCEGSKSGIWWVPPDVTEMVRWTAIPIRHGSLDGMPGTLNSQYKKTDPRYDGVIADAMTYSRYRQIGT